MITFIILVIIIGLYVRETENGKYVGKLDEKGRATK